MVINIDEFSQGDRNMQTTTVMNSGNLVAREPVPARFTFFQQAYRGSASLAILGWAMVADLVFSLAAILLDPATVDGSPAWLKPLKFAISTTLFSFTVAWMIGSMERSQRLARWMGRVMTASLALEIVLIDMQAARHTSSHYNLATKFDSVVWMAMGSGIAILTVSTVLLFVATCMERFRDRSLAWAVRLGLALALVGMASGSMMSLPTPQQLAAAHAGKGMPRSGAHTVGASDGGPGMSVTGWSADHGDLRIAHFLGLHAMQGLLLAWWMTRARWTEGRQSRLMKIVAASFLALFALTLWQALRGQAFLRPDEPTWIGWVCWLAGSAGALLWLGRQANQNQRSGIQESIGAAR